MWFSFQFRAYNKKCTTLALTFVIHLHKKCKTLVLAFVVYRWAAYFVWNSKTNEDLEKLATFEVFSELKLTLLKKIMRLFALVSVIIADFNIDDALVLFPFLWIINRKFKVNHATPSTNFLNSIYIVRNTLFSLNLNIIYRYLWNGITLFLTGSSTYRLLSSLRKCWAIIMLMTHELQMHAMGTIFIGET